MNELLAKSGSDAAKHLMLAAVTAAASVLQTAGSYGPEHKDDTKRILADALQVAVPAAEVAARQMKLEHASLVERQLAIFNFGAWQGLVGLLTAARDTYSAIRRAGDLAQKGN